MKEFITAVDEVIEADENEAAIAALVAEGKTREEAEAEVGGFVEFKLDGRVMRAYKPNDGQLIFLMAALGRGQTKESRFASIINIMFESLREEDKDHMESRLLSRDPKTRLKPAEIESIFEHLSEEWFARPTQPPSASAVSPQTDGHN